MLHARWDILIATASTLKYDTNSSCPPNWDRGMSYSGILVCLCLTDLLKGYLWEYHPMDPVTMIASFQRGQRTWERAGWAVKLRVASEPLRTLTFLGSHSSRENDSRLRLGTEQPLQLSKDALHLHWTRELQCTPRLILHSTAGLEPSLWVFECTRSKPAAQLKPYYQ
jgi:hypothetical protein